MNHREKLRVVDLRGGAWTAAALNTVLTRHGITANTTGLPARSGGSLGLRLGSTLMTIRGMDAAMARQLGGEIAKLLRGEEDPRRLDRIAEWARNYPLLAA